MTIRILPPRIAGGISPTKRTEIIKLRQGGLSLEAISEIVNLPWPIVHLAIFDWRRANRKTRWQ
ncbi:MAG: hypothetical protein AAF416_15590 [Pseudomonadota bacterium]